MKKKIKFFSQGVNDHCNSSTLKFIAFLFICNFADLESNAQKQKTNSSIIVSGVVKDAVNGMLLDSVIISAGEFSTTSDAEGVYTLKLIAKDIEKEKLTFTKKNFYSLQMAVPAKSTNNIVAKMKSPYPLLNILHLFTDETIPNRGPNESPTTPKCADTTFVPDLIGGQLKRHNFIYIGENYRRICVVIDGKLAWQYDTENTWEDDEIWVLSNGNILHAHMKYIEELTPKKEVVWRYDNPPGTEIHTCQPIGTDKVLFLQNQGLASVVKLYNKVNKKFEIDKELKELSGSVHGQCRRLRMTDRGTFVAATMSTHTFYEYDKNFNLIWSFDPGQMWGGVPLKNGNFLLQNEKSLTSIEINRKGEIVWQVSIADIQNQLDSLAPNLGKVTATQTCERLSNGNTVVFTRFCNSQLPQAIEVTPEKKVVWILQDWKNLGDSVSAQFFDEPGYPEIPGDTNH